MKFQSLHRFIAAFAGALACSSEATPPPTDGGSLDVADPPVCASPLRAAGDCPGATDNFIGICNPDRVLAREDESQCQCQPTMPWVCRYEPGRDGRLDHTLIRCGVVDTLVRFQFRVSPDGLPVGRMLVKDQDFTVLEVIDAWHRQDGRVTSTRSTGPVLGTLTVSVVGPPLYEVPGRSDPTLPQLRVVGELCASRLNARFRVSTVQAWQ